MWSQPDTRNHGQEVRMRAAVYRRFGPPEVVQIEEVPQPRPGPAEVLVKVHASTVSASDHRCRGRAVPPGLSLPSALAIGVFRPRRRILGMDVAGVVEAVGAGVTSFGPGDEVIAMLGSRFGGHAEYVCIPQEGAIASKPRNMTFAEAVTLVFGGTTAHALLSRAAITPGATVLINGPRTRVVQVRGDRRTRAATFGNIANHENSPRIRSD